MDVPIPDAVRKPEPVTTVATPAVLLLHVPGVVASVSVVVELWHNMSVPRMGVTGFTVTTCATPQVPTMYDIVVVPPEMPVTTPVADTVATPTTVELQVPPANASVRFVITPWQIVVGVPVIAGGHKMSS